MKEQDRERAVVEVGFHSLRHTYVSLHAERGTPAAILQDNVGHSNPAMTRHYTHISELSAKEYAGVLPALLEAGPKQTTGPAFNLPPDVVKALQGMNDKNWENVRERMLKGGAA